MDVHINSKLRKFMLGFYYVVNFHEQNERLFLTLLQLLTKVMGSNLIFQLCYR